MAGLIVLDASVLIAHLDASHDHHARATGLLAETRAAPLEASPVTIAEVLVGPARAGRMRDARSALRALGVGERPFGADASARLATLRAATDLKLPDCCVLLAAEDAAADSVFSFDDRVAAAASAAGFSVP